MGEDPMAKEGQLSIVPERIRRCRSLNELPGHHRVTILKRPDTERTRARFEAVAAGMEELKNLREKQKQLMDETLSESSRNNYRHRSETDSSLMKQRASNHSNDRHDVPYSEPAIQRTFGHSQHHDNQSSALKSEYSVHGGPNATSAEIISQYQRKLSMILSQHQVSEISAQEKNTLSETFSLRNPHRPASLIKNPAVTLHPGQLSQENIPPQDQSYRRTKFENSFAPSIKERGPINLAIDSSNEKIHLSHNDSSQRPTRHCNESTQMTDFSLDGLWHQDQIFQKDSRNQQDSGLYINVQNARNQQNVLNIVNPSHRGSKYKNPSTEDNKHISYSKVKNMDSQGRPQENSVATHNTLTHHSSSNQEPLRPHPQYSHQNCQNSPRQNAEHGRATKHIMSDAKTSARESLDLKPCYSSDQTIGCLAAKSEGVATSNSGVVSRDLGVDYRHHVVMEQSSQRFSRGRTQSVHENFYYFPSGNESNKFQHKYKDSSDTLRKNQHADGQQYQETHSRSSSNSTDRSLCKDPPIATSCTPDMTSTAQSKSISWDELLVSVGLSKQDNQMNKEDGGSCPSHVNVSALLNEEKTPTKVTITQSRKSQNEIYNPQEVNFYLVAMNHKPYRSQSFSIPSSAGQVMLIPTEVEHVNHKRQRTGSLNHAYLTGVSRHPSLQTINSKQIMNPLHEVDIRSLDRPGPVHAVTLQYAGLTSRHKSMSSLAADTAIESVSYIRDNQHSLQTNGPQIKQSGRSQSQTTQSATVHSSVSDHRNEDISKMSSKKHIHSASFEPPLTDNGKSGRADCSSEIYMKITEANNRAHNSVSSYSPKVSPIKTIEEDCEDVFDNSLKPNVYNHQLKNTSGTSQKAENPLLSPSFACYKPLKDDKRLDSEYLSCSVTRITCDYNSSEANLDDKNMSTESFLSTSNDINPDDVAGRVWIKEVRDMTPLVKSDLSSPISCVVSSEVAPLCSVKLHDTTSGELTHKHYSSLDISETTLITDEGYITCDSGNPKLPADGQSTDGSSISSGSVQNISSGSFQNISSCGEKMTLTSSKNILTNDEITEAKMATFTDGSKLIKNVDERNDHFVHKNKIKSSENFDLAQNVNELYGDAKNVQSKPTWARLAVAGAHGDDLETLNCISETTISNECDNKSSFICEVQDKPNKQLKRPFKQTDL